MLEGCEPAFTNFQAMSLSVRKTYARAYFDAKTGAGREKRLAWMVRAARLAEQKPYAGAGQAVFRQPAPKGFPAGEFQNIAHNPLLLLSVAVLPAVAEHQDAFVPAPGGHRRRQPGGAGAQYHDVVLLANSKTSLTIRSSFYLSRPLDLCANPPNFTTKFGSPAWRWSISSSSSPVRPGRPG